MTTPRRGQESDWALKKVLAEGCRINETVYDCEARLLRNEHARSVRIVKRQIQYGRDNWRSDAYVKACNDILAALTKGRGKGRLSRLPRHAGAEVGAAENGVDSAGRGAGKDENGDTVWGKIKK